MQPPQRRPLISGRLAFFLVGMAFAEAARTMTVVQIPVYLRELGADISQIGLFFTLSLIFPLALRILGGWISDVIGRLQAIVIGSLAGLLAYLAFAFAPEWEFALFGPAFLALTMALIFPSYKAYVADQTPAETHGRVFGISETTITVAWIIGPPVGGLIAENYGYRSMFAASVAAYAISAVIFVIMLRTEKAAAQPDPEVTPDLSNLRTSFARNFAFMLSGGLITWLIIADGVRDVAFRLSFDLMPVYLREIGGLSKGSIGLLDGIFGVALAFANLAGGWLRDRTSERFSIVLGIMVLVFSRLVFALAGSFGGFAFSWILLGAGGGLLDPAYSSLIAKGVPLHMRGMTYGLLATSLGLISLPSPWIGSQMWNLLGPRAPFLLSVALGLLAIYPAWKKLVLPPEDAESVASGPNVAAAD